LLYCLALILYALVSLAWTHEPQPAFIIYSHGLLAEGILLTLLVGLLLTKLFLTLLAGHLVTEVDEFLTQVRHTLLDVA
jgi:hypothetical protein